MMTLHAAIVDDSPHLWGLPAEPSHIGLVAMTGQRSGLRYTAVCDAGHASMVSELMHAMHHSELVSLPPDPYLLIRSGWPPEWSDSARADPSAWRSAAVVFAMEDAGGAQ